MTLPAEPTELISKGSLDAAIAGLLSWYQQHRRDLPWRRTRDPYRIWVSEVMLQQTQVATVIPYYVRFLEHYPTVEALAETSLDELLALWQGLGYYARARHLWRAAQIVADQHQGRLPSTRAELLALPGIGDYTAGAILSIAYDQDTPAIDGNVKRVLARLFDLAIEVKSSAARRWLLTASERLLPTGHASAYNQAMMELGAAICLPTNPNCAACPLGGICLARQRGTIARRPMRARRSRIPTREMAAAYCLRDGNVLIVRRRPAGLLGGLWELPNWEIEDALDAPALLGRQLASEVPVGQALLVVRHAYTHFAVRVHVFACTPGAFEPAAPWDSAHWLAPEELPTYGLTGVTQNALQQLAWSASQVL